MNKPTRRVAVIGSGIAGLATAWHLGDPAAPVHTTLFEADARLGGHANTVDVTLPDAQGQMVTHGVDTGFLVFNHRTYPQLRALFAKLGVETAASDMSFSVQAEGGALEWAGSDLSSVFAQRRNLLRPRFVGMLWELMRFNRLTTELALDGSDGQLTQSIGDFLDEHRFSAEFRRWYFLPMIGCIWSCPTEQMLRFPVATMIRFCHNHGLLQVNDRPQWMTVRGGSRQYIERMRPRIAQVRLATPVKAVRRAGTHGGAQVVTATGSEQFDEVVFACHPDQALALLGNEASLQERAVLGAIRYHDNHAVLHTDTALLPRARRAWAAWNYEHAPQPATERAGVCLHYLINRLQPLPFRDPVLVSLNPVRAPRPETVLARFDYAHPIFDAAAMTAQRRVPDLQGQHDRWFCGAWTGYGFHEDGLKSALAVVDGLRAHWARGAQRLAA